MKRRFRISRIIIVAILIYVVYVLISRQQVLISYKKEGQKYKEAIAEEQQKNADLLQEKDNINSKEYVEQIARDKLGMYLPNERVYIDISK